MKRVTNLVSAPSQQPIDVLDVKDQLRLDYDYDTEDTFLDRLVAAATKRIEGLTGRKLITQTWQAFWDAWPAKADGFEVPFGQLQSVTHVQYTDTDDSATTWNASQYEVDTYGDPGRIKLAYGCSYPTATLQVVNPIEVQFVCGYGLSEEDVPEDLRHAMKLLIGHWFENREGALGMPGLTAFVEIPEGVHDLIRDYVIWGFHW